MGGGERREYQLFYHLTSGGLCSALGNSSDLIYVFGAHPAALLRQESWG